MLIKKGLPVLIRIQLIILTFLFLALWLYHPLTSFFSQDDFFHLRVIMDKKILDVPSFFISRLEGQTFYRPLSRETYNLFMYTLFGLNPLPFHLFNFGLILLNLYLMIKLLKDLTPNLPLIFFFGLTFSLSAVHNIEIYYLSSVQNLLSTTFVLTSMIFFIDFLNSRILNSILASILFYCLALFSHESAIVLPGILFLYVLLSRKCSIRRTFFLIVPFIFIGLIFLLSSASITSLPDQAVYKPVFKLKSIFNTLGWYILWSFGLPEMLVDFVGPKLSLKNQFITWYGYYAKITFPLLFFIISLLLLLFWSFKRMIMTNKLFIFFIASFLLAVSPFTIFPQHKFVYYLELPVIWFCAVLGVILATAWRSGTIYKLFVIFLLISFAIISYQTANLNAITHWAAKRPKAAKAVIEQLKIEHLVVERTSVFYIIDDPNYPDIAKEWGTSSRQAFYILSGSDAFKLFYNSSSIEAYYQAVGGLPDRFDKKKVIKFMAKFPY